MTSVFQHVPVPQYWYHNTDPILVEMTVVPAHIHPFLNIINQFHITFSPTYLVIRPLPQGQYHNFQSWGNHPQIPDIFPVLFPYRSDRENILDTGMDSCEYFISTNIGEELRPVAKIASGGEISRIMLAIKMALQSKDIVNTLIFDEIDSGISGATAERIGETFEKLAESHQILCITHLSQIAGKGDTHFKVSKNIKGERIVVNVNKLTKTDRIGEIATLISGRKITESSRKQAEELLQANG